jgi:hypothetical protein
VGASSRVLRRALGPRGQVGPPSPSPGPNPGPENPARGRPRRSDRFSSYAVVMDIIDHLLRHRLGGLRLDRRGRHPTASTRGGRSEAFRRVRYGPRADPGRISEALRQNASPRPSRSVSTWEKAGRHSVGPSFSHGGCSRDTLTFGLATCPAGATTEPRLTHPLGPAATDCPCGLAGAHPDRGRSAPIAACSGGHSGGHSAGHN